MTRVLVVDDEPQIVRAQRVNLVARSYDVATATNGSHALTAAAREHPDVVVLDLGLPDIDGVDVVRSLREWSSVPILILSGRLNSTEKIRALDAGADDLRQYTAQLRRKIESDPSRPRHLVTEPGMGYRFQPDETDV